MMMVGYAAQKSLLPVNIESIEKALDMNGVAISSTAKHSTWVDSLRTTQVPCLI
jgi:hypothetical protein